MITNYALQANRLKRLLCTILAGVFLCSAERSAFAQTSAYYSIFAGTGTNGYYVGDNNDATTARFSQPRGMTVDPSGNILICDAGNYVIRKIGTDKKMGLVAGIPQTMGSNNPWPSGSALSTAIPTAGSQITIAGNGAIYFQGNGRMVGTIFNGNISYFQPEHMTAGYFLPVHNSMKARGNFLYLGHQGFVSVIDLTTRKQVRQINLPGSATSIMALALDANGNIFCLNAFGQLSRTDGTTFTSTVLKAENSDYELYSTTGADMAIDNTGNIYIATDLAFVLRYAAVTYTKGRISGGGSARFPSVTVDAAGTVYIPDRSQNRIVSVQYLNDNTTLTSLGVSAGTLSPAFNIYASSFSVSVPNNVSKISVTPTIDAGSTTAQIRINGGTYVPIASGAASAEMDLNVGANTINIALQAQHPSYSRTVNITVTRLGIPPPTPNNLVASPLTNSVRLNWEAAPGATKYNVYRGTTPDNLFLLAGSPTTALTFTNNISVGTTFYYAVSALEATNAESPKTSTIAGKANTPPVVSALLAAGGAWLGRTLTADYTYTDADGGINASTYLWYRYPQETGNTGRVTIPGANTKTYTLTTDDIGKYISVRVAPNDGITGGTAVESARVLVTAGTLPVKLISFQSQFVNGTVQLQWKTATEINSDYFSIERSSDARNWESIGRVNAAGDSYNERSYAFTDKSPLSGQSYYRLKTVDRDATFETSSTVQVDVSAPATMISVYPIPATSTITVKGGDRSRGQSYIISDAAGNTVRKGSLTQTTQDINIQELKTGFYFLKVEKHQAVRFIKQ